MQRMHYVMLPVFRDNNERMMTMLERLKKPWVIAGLAALAYRLLTETYGIAIDNESWQFTVDALSYVLIGIGVYSGAGSEKTSE